MNKNLFISLFLLLFGASCVQAANYLPAFQQDGSNGMQDYSSNVTSNPDPFAKAPTTNSYSDVAKIESSLFSRTYDNQNMSTRLSRIEKSLFNKTYPNSTDLQRIDNAVLNFNQINKYPNISKNSLSKIESQLFSQKYPMNNPQRRIERIEENLFGAVQSGDLNKRLDNIQSAVKAYSSNNNTALNNDYINPAPRRGLRGLVGSLSSMMNGGAMTGFTPQFSPYFNQNNDMYSGNNYPANTTGYNPYSTYGIGGGATGQSMRSNHGYYNGFQNFNSGTGVTILD